MKLIEHHSAPSFNFKDRLWFVDEKDSFRDNGRPAWLYNHDDGRPIPINDWGAGKDHLQSKIDPKTVFAAFKDKTIQEMHGLGQKSKIGAYGLIILLVVLVVFFISVINAYYAYNAFCGINPNACGKTPVPGT